MAEFISKQTKEYSMRLLIAGLILTFVGLFFWFVYPSDQTHPYGITLLIKVYAPYITGLGVIGAVIGYFTGI